MRTKFKAERLRERERGGGEWHNDKRHRVRESIKTIRKKRIGNELAVLEIQVMIAADLQVKKMYLPKHGLTT